MESALFSVGASTMSFLCLSKSRNANSTPAIAQMQRRFSNARPIHVALLHLSRDGEVARLLTSSLVRGLGLRDLWCNKLDFSVRYSASLASGGGGFGGIDGGAGGGGGSDGGETKPAAVAPGTADGPALGSDVIVLEVGGMTCGGCAQSVKRILESQPQVSSASVNLTTETAIVWPVLEAKVVPNWQKDVGEALAKHLTSCGFKSNLRDQGAVDGES